MSAKSVPPPRIGKGPGINFEKSNEKLNNPKETTFRILKYIGNKKIISYAYICILCNNNISKYNGYKIKWRYSR